MASTVKYLEDKGLIRPPSFLSCNIQYECIMGSVAYGVSSDTSDVDLYGWCVPPKNIIFPHLAGYVQGFDRDVPNFEQYQKHHIIDTNKNYDITIYGIVKYFRLLLDNNPNMIDSLFVPRNCILHTTQVGELVRENRRKFLHKGCYHKFKGYAFSQLSRCSNSQNSKEMKDILEFEDEYGIDRTTTYKQAMQCSVPMKNTSDKLIFEPDTYDVYIKLWEDGLNKTNRFEQQKIRGGDSKFLYHIVRLCDECDQILNTGDLNLQRAKNQMKAVRNGEWSLEHVKEWFAEQEKTLEESYRNSSLPYSPNEKEIKSLLFKCLEHHYGSLDKAISVNPDINTLIMDVRNVLRKYET